MKQETFEIKTEIYEEMVFQYFSALDRIMDLELENNEMIVGSLSSRSA